ncbi:hypothetical protein ACFYYR_15700 [Streptomyces sp. NPDC001922]|uniref:hypothetical protein n=1 Tax=Streptomyces sp. NPDC001922 TaxID=3364624 RepID=UPI0036A9595E
MRTSIKASVLAIAAVAALGVSATTATAHERHAKDGDLQANICGNTDQTAFAFDDAALADVDQEAEGPVFCQNGENNTAINYAPESGLIYLGDLGLGALPVL